MVAEVREAVYNLFFFPAVKVERGREELQEKEIRRGLVV